MALPRFVLLNSFPTLINACEEYEMLLLVAGCPCGSVAHPHTTTYGIQELEYSYSFKQKNKSYW